MPHAERSTSAAGPSGQNQVTARTASDKKARMGAHGNHRERHREQARRHLLARGKATCETAQEQRLRRHKREPQKRRQLRGRKAHQQARCRLHKEREHRCGKPLRNGELPRRDTASTSVRYVPRSRSSAIT